MRDAGGLGAGHVLGRIADDEGLLGPQGEAPEGVEEDLGLGLLEADRAAVDDEGGVLGQAVLEAEPAEVPEGVLYRQ